RFGEHFGRENRPRPFVRTAEDRNDANPEGHVAKHRKPRQQTEPPSGPTGDERVDRRLAEYESAHQALEAGDGAPSSMAVNSVDDVTRPAGNADETEIVSEADGSLQQVRHQDSTGR